MRQKRMLALALALAMMFSLTACSGGGDGETTAAGGTEAAGETTAAAGGETQAAAEGEEGSAQEGAFNIGVYQWMSGNAASIGEEMKVAFEIAVEDMGGTVNGEEVNFIYYDTTNNPETAVTAAQYLIGQNVDAVIGSFQSSDVVAALPYLEDAGIVNVFMGTSGSLVTDDQKYSVRGAFNADYSIPQFVATMQELQYENVAVFYGQDEASIANWGAMEPALEEAGLNVVAVETGSESDTDYSAQCLKIVDSNPDVVYVVCSGAGVNFVKQLREYGYNGIVMNKDEWMTSHVDQIGEANSQYVMGCVAYTTYKSIEAAEEAGARPEVITFLEKFQEKTGTLPTVGITYRCYDSCYLMLEAAKRAGTNHDADAIIEAMLGINDISLCMGPVDFTQGDREPCHEFMRTIYVDEGSKNFDSWLTNGGYDAYKSATGREK